MGLVSASLSTLIGLIVCFLMDETKKLDRFLLKMGSLPFYMPTISVAFAFIDSFGENSFTKHLISIPFSL